MSAFTVEKTENCFTDAQTYAYASPLKMDETTLEAFARFGEMEIKRNYRRPFYFIRGGGMEIKGILGDTRFKVSYQPRSRNRDRLSHGPEDTRPCEGAFFTE